LLFYRGFLIDFRDIQSKAFRTKNNHKNTKYNLKIAIVLFVTIHELFLLLYVFAFIKDT